MKLTRTIAWLGAVGALAVATTGCDDDSTPRRIDLSGVVAMGAPVVGAQVRAEGANGVMTDIHLLTDANGNYNLNGFGLTAPVVIRSEGGIYDHDGDSLTLPISAPDLVSITYSNSGAVTSNLTPLSMLALQQATGISGVDALYNTLTGAMPPSRADIEEAAAIVRANLATVAAANGITNWTDYDLFGTTFDADPADSFDNVLDDVSCTATGTVAGSDFTVSCSGSITSFDPAIDISDYYDAGGTDGGGGGGGGGGGSACTGPACQMTATYTITFGIPGILANQTQTVTETVSGSVSGLDVAAIQNSVNNEYDTATGVNVTVTLDTPTHKTFRATFQYAEGLPMTANYVVTYDYVQL